MSLNEHNSKVMGMIVNIQHFCLHDGDGIRTTVFFKGCPLQCVWCCNPETQHTYQELACYRNLCNGCMQCLNVCKKEAIAFKGKGISSILSNCDLCMNCVNTCTLKAIKSYGRNVSIDDIMKEIREDLLFYRQSGGGITLSGGEILMQSEFAKAILEACKKEGIHSVVETSAYGDFQDLIAIAQLADMVYIDIKHMDTSLHKMYTKVSNEIIIDNILKLNEAGIDFVIRIPIIPGINDDENLLDTFTFVRKLKHCTRIGLIPYQKYGISKYEALNRNYTLTNVHEPMQDILEYFCTICIEHFHIPCEIGW